MTEHVQILKNRTDIAQTINGRNMTVVRLDIADVDDYGLKSEPVVIDNGKFPAKYGWPEMPDMIHSRIRDIKEAIRLGRNHIRELRWVLGA